MNTITRCMAFSFVFAVNAGMSNAANHPSSFGEFVTAVNESRLFITDKEITTLRCDLFFSAAGSDQQWVAPKGTAIRQSVPSFVWQYSGLLPISDYLRTVAIHSVSSDAKENAWQDVQLAFYNGLRTEGAPDAEAKVAYAGAYAFAPRWPLVELIDITVPERDKETRLFKVNYVLAETKGVSIEEYQALARDILDDPQSVSLQDIRGIVDAADASANSQQQGVVGGSIDDLFASDGQVEVSAEESVAGEKVKAKMKTPLDELFVNKSIQTDTVLPAEIKPEKPEDDLPGVFVEVAPQAEVTSKAILGPEDIVIDGVEVNVRDDDTDKTKRVLKVNTELGSQPAVWETQPDGSAVLLQIEG